MSRELYEIKAGPLQEDAELRAAIHDQLEPFFEYPYHYDLRGLPYDEVVNLIHRLMVTSNLALHGSDSETPYAELDPDYSKQITKVPSVFATTDARVVLMNAIFQAHGDLVEQIRYEFDEGNKFAASMYTHGQTEIFEAPPGIANALREALVLPEKSNLFSQLFTDGVVYFAAGRSFTRDNPSLGEDGTRRGGADFTDHELNSPTKVSPLATARVSGQLAYELFRMNGDESDTVHVYSEVEMESRRRRRREVMEPRARMLGGQATGFSSQS